MSDGIEKMLSTLLFDKQAKDILISADKVLNSKSKHVRENAFAMLVVASEGCGVSSYGSVYSTIVDASLSTQIRGTSTFLELVFPKDNEVDERLFFASPRRKASIRNRFYGTMLISLKEFKGQDLIKSDSLNRLLEFVALNKSNIHFMFHILPEFSAKNRLIVRLQEIVNITEVILDKPNLENGYAYVISELKAQGYEIEEEAQRYLMDCVLSNIVSEKAYAGYRSLNALLSRLNLEVAMMTDDLFISAEVVKNLMVKYGKENEHSENEVSRIGFC